MSGCEQLDDYLDGDLTPEQASRFREHSQVCGECRANLEAMAEFGGFVSEARSSFDDWYVEQSERTNNVPALALSRSEPSIKRRVAISVAIIAATIAAVLAARTITLPASGDGQREVVKADSTKSNGSKKQSNGSIGVAEAVKPQRTKTSITMPQDSGYLAQPIQSSNPNITIYWLHPTMNTKAKKAGDDSSATPEQETKLLARARRTI